MNDFSPISKKDKEGRELGIDLLHSEYKVKKHKAGGKLVYDSQKMMAVGICEQLWTTHTLVITLVAQMQWGKTGVLLEVAYKCATHPSKSISPENVIILTGLSDQEWKEQTQDRMMRDFKVWMRQDVKNHIEILSSLRNGLIIIDECHFASSENTVLQQTLLQSGLLDLEQLEERNIRIIQTSATPDNILLDSKTFENTSDDEEDQENPKDRKHRHKTLIPDLTDSPTYVGLAEIKKDGRLKQVLDLTKTTRVEILIDHMKKFETPKYHIIRVPNSSKTQPIVIDNLVKASISAGFATPLNHNGKEPLEDVDTLLNQVPEKHTIILIKDLWRQAKTFTDTNIGIVHERLCHNKSNSAEAQGLAGRLCGHHKQRGDQAPYLYCDLDSVNRYIELFTHGFNYLRPGINWRSGTLVTRNGVVRKKANSYAGDLAADDQVVVISPPLVEPHIEKLKTEEEVKEYYRQLKLRFPEKFPDSSRGPNKRSFLNTNSRGFYEATIRSVRKVYSTKEMWNERRCNIRNGAGYGLRPCYTDTSDPRTLEWWFIYYK